MPPNSPFTAVVSFFFLVSATFFNFLRALPVLPDPDPVQVQSFLPAPSPPAIIPAFPEQSEAAACPLDLPNDFFPHVKAACATPKKGGSDQLHRSRCCPVLAAWLYSAYSDTALGRTTGRAAKTAYDMPLLPDDSETCVDGLEKALRGRGIELMGPNESCDPVLCYCGIRLHPLSCPEAFGVSEKGKLVGDESVRRLETECLSNGDGNGFPGLAGLGGCSKCLHSLYQMNKDKRTGNSSKYDERTTKMRNKDCELMGLTWLLAKNRTAYIRTVTAVLRSLMMTIDGSQPQSCTLNADGMPLAVDSSEIGGQSSSSTVRSSAFLGILSYLVCYACMYQTLYFTGILMFRV